MAGLRCCWDRSWLSWVWWPCHPLSPYQPSSYPAYPRYPLYLQYAGNISTVQYSASGQTCCKHYNASGKITKMSRTWHLVLINEWKVCWTFSIKIILTDDHLSDVQKAARDRVCVRWHASVHAFRQIITWAGVWSREHVFYKIFKKCKTFPKIIKTKNVFLVRSTIGCLKMFNNLFQSLNKIAKLNLKIVITLGLFAEWGIFTLFL